MTHVIVALHLKIVESGCNCGGRHWHRHAWSTYLSNGNGGILSFQRNIFKNAGKRWDVGAMQFQTWDYIILYHHNTKFLWYGLWSVNHGCLTHIRPLRDSESEASLISYGFSMGFGAFMVRRVIRFFAEGWENEVALVHGNWILLTYALFFTVRSQYESFISILLLR